MPEFPLSPAVVVERNAKLLSTELDGELILMSIDAGKYFSLDAIGAEIWRHFETPAPVATVLRKLVKKYHAEPAVIERDVMHLLSDLMMHGLIQGERPMRGKLILLEASAALIASGLMLRLLPFRLVARLAGRLGETPSADDSAFDRRTTGVGRAISRAARRLPWHCNCLVRAVAGRLMLARRRIPSTLSFGVATDTGQVQAHAWLTAGGTVICGAAEMEDFAPIAEFVGGPVR